ncbi:hypothetical protein LLG46_02350 [bacterium]|nr:hypothetical protein [bacterium]
MADQAISPVELGINTASDAVTATLLAAANDGVITPVSDKMIIELTDTSEAGATVLIKAGGDDSPLGGQGDITVTLGASETKAIYVESARVKALSGTDKGKIRLDASAAVSAKVFQLP